MCRFEGKFISQHIINQTDRKNYRTSPVVKVKTVYQFEGKFISQHIINQTDRKN